MLAMGEHKAVHDTIIKVITFRVNVFPGPRKKSVKKIETDGVK